MKKMKKSAIVLLTLISAFAFNVQSIFAANVSSWDKFLNKGADYTYSSPSFNMKSSSVTISGYHYLPPFTDNQTAKYQIVIKGFFSDDVKGETIVTGYYPDPSQKFSKTVSLSSSTNPPAGVVIKVINASDVNGIVVKGDASQ